MLKQVVGVERQVSEDIADIAKMKVLKSQFPSFMGMYEALSCPWQI
jgi:hypothetical protein